MLIPNASRALTVLSSPEALRSLLRLALASVYLGFLLGQAAPHWPQFRGPSARGVSDGPLAPLTWNPQTQENIAWTAELPGLGHASPVIWNDRIYIATTLRPGTRPELKIGLYGDGDSYQEKEPHQWRLLAFEKASGRPLWNRLVHEAVPRLERHTKASHFNATPATDGQHLVAILGSEGLFGLDMEGRTLWKHDLGKMDAGPYNAPTLQWGFASSPVLHDGRVYVQCDVLSTQFVAAFDAATGRSLWHTPRREVATWSTPAIAHTPSRSQLICNGWKHIAGYDLLTGQELWRLQEGGDIPVASPIVTGNLVVLTSGHGRYRPMRAVRLDATGDITTTEMGATNQSVVWCHPRLGNYLQTPIAVGHTLWGCHDNGVVSCFDVPTGQLHFSERLGGGGQGFTASPVSDGRHLFFTGEQGDVFVLPTTPTFKILATNRLGDLCLASPAISEGQLFFRTREHLLAIGTAKPPNR